MSKQKCFSLDSHLSSITLGQLLNCSEAYKMEITIIPISYSCETNMNQNVRHAIIAEKC